jgi:hypothetical protein
MKSNGLRLITHFATRSISGAAAIRLMRLAALGPVGGGRPNPGPLRPESKTRFIGLPMREKHFVVSISIISTNTPNHNSNKLLQQRQNLVSPPPE